MSESSRHLACIAWFASTIGCASIHPAVLVNGSGEDNPEADAAYGEQATDSRELPNVKVIRGRIPEGLDLRENGTKLVVAPGYEQKYTVLGSVEGDYVREAQGAFVKNFWWTWDYDEGWRKGLCYWQVPLEIATLSLWSYLVPLHYPCVAIVPGEMERKVELNTALKRGAAAMGGNLVILVAEGGVTIVSGDRNSVSTSVYPGMSLKGIVLKENAVTVLPPAAAKPVAPET